MSDQCLRECSMWSFPRCLDEPLKKDLKDTSSPAYCDHLDSKSSKSGEKAEAESF